MDIGSELDILIRFFSNLILICLLVSFLNMLFSMFFFEINKNNCIVVFVSSFMVKMVVICTTLFIDLVLEELEIHSTILIIISIISIFIFEGFLYNKIIKRKDENGIVVSIACNFFSIIAIIVFAIIRSK